MGICNPPGCCRSVGSIACAYPSGPPSRQRAKPPTHGDGSVASQADTASFGSAGNERRLTNVTAGVNSTDAVKVSQLSSIASGLQGQINGVNQRIDVANAGVAMAMALTGGYPLQDTIIQRWRDPADGIVCYIYLPITAAHSPPTQSGYVQYGAACRVDKGAIRDVGVWHNIARLCPRVSVPLTARLTRGQIAQPP